jgi:hypothetical protein
VSGIGSASRPQSTWNVITAFPKCGPETQPQVSGAGGTPARRASPSRSRVSRSNDPLVEVVFGWCPETSNVRAFASVTRTSHGPPIPTQIVAEVVSTCRSSGAGLPAVRKVPKHFDNR